MARSWAELPAGRVVRLSGASADAIALSIDPLPAGAPAVVTYHATAARSPGELVAAILDALEKVATGVFPAWLPQARGIDSPAGASVPAVRALALRLAAASGQFGPFLADLAEQALRRRDGGRGRFPAEVRAAGLARVIAASFDRPRAALLVRVPDDLPPVGEDVLVAACEWMAHHGGLGVWLTGAPLRAVDRVQAVTIALPAQIAILANDVPTSGAPSRPGHVEYPAIAGLPSASSRAEKALEVALATCDWAAGRAWNQEHRSHTLANPVRVDLLWRAERCVVEIDGPEHRGALKFASDRRRDVQLQLDGYAVLRFTNDQIADDLAAVLTQLERFLRARRPEPMEGRRHAEE